MDVTKLKDTIDKITSKVNVPDDKKNELIARLSSLSEKEVINALSQIVFRALSDNEELYTFSLEAIRDINPEICPDVTEMKSILNKMYSNEVEGNMTVEENNKLVIQELVKYTKLLNQYGIDYYVVGALPCFLKTGQPLFRYHDDIDIMVNEEDIPKLAELIESSGYEFHDDRFPSIERFKEMEEKKPPHTVLAQNPNNEFHLGFFTFRRENDNSITMTEYSHRLEDGEVVIDVLERRSDPVGTMLRYDDKPVEFMDTSFRTGTTENVYILKGYTKRPKDYTDMEYLKPYIDEKKVEALREHPLSNEEIRNINNKGFSR